jgi:epidermal growth factor receptor substrate 15
VSAVPLSQSQRGMSLGQSQGPGGAWAIDATEKAQSDQFFDMLDTSRQGILQGDVAVPFFVQSGLPEETLAQIWDLSDIRKEGSLTKEEFAVARRLVMDVIAGKPLPNQLDQSMIPPSLRATAQRLQNQPQRK